MYINSFNIHNDSVKYCIVKPEWLFQLSVRVCVSFLNGCHCPESDTQLSCSVTGLLCGQPEVNGPRQIGPF